MSVGDSQPKQYNISTLSDPYPKESTDPLCKCCPCLSGQIPQFDVRYLLV